MIESERIWHSDIATWRLGIILIVRDLVLVERCHCYIPRENHFQISICILEGTEGNRWVARVGRRGGRKVSI